MTRHDRKATAHLNRSTSSLSRHAADEISSPEV